LSAEDIDVTVQGSSLTLKIRQTENHMAGSDRTADRETITRTSIRNVRLPDDLQTDGIEASYADGLLKIRRPKKHRTTQRIRIRTESGSASHE
jgi:HSP20 family protein